MCETVNFPSKSSKLSVPFRASEIPQRVSNNTKERSNWIFSLRTKTSKLMTGVAGRAKTVVADPELSVALQRTLVAGIARRETPNTRPKAFVERLCGPRYSSFSILPRFTGFMDITYGVIVHKVRLREIVLGAVNLTSNRGFSSVAFGLIFGISLN